MDDVARSQPPPRWLQALLNPVLRKVLRTRVGGRIPAALLCFDGRRSGRRFEVPVGVHDAPDGPVVLTPSRWGENFRGGADAELVRHGRSTPVRGVIIEDAAQAGRIVRSIVDAGTPPRQFGVKMPAGHRLTDDEVAALRTIILLTPR